MRDNNKYDTEIVFSLITNADGLLTKTIRPDGQGGIVRTPAADMYRGFVQAIRMPFEEFGPFLRKVVKDNQAISHGIVPMGCATIVTAANWDGSKRFIVTRTKQHFHYPVGVALAMLDFDPKPGQQPLTPDELCDIIISVWPEFEDTPTWMSPSTSSCISDLKGNELTGVGHGFHIYFSVAHGTDLTVIAETLFIRLWIAGHGYIFISKDGKQLLRTVFDAAVFSPERLDFVAGANCVDCVQHLPNPVYRPGAGPVEGIAPLIDNEQTAFLDLIAKAKADIKTEAEVIKAAYIDTRALVVAKKQGITVKQARKNLRACVGGELLAGDIIFFREHGEIAVKDALRKPWLYDGAGCLDPIEPEEGHGRALFYANQGKGKPQIFSQLHGGRTFKLKANKKKTRKKTRRPAAAEGGRYGRK